MQPFISKLEGILVSWDTPIFFITREFGANYQKERNVRHGFASQDVYSNPPIIWTLRVYNMFNQ